MLDYIKITRPFNCLMAGIAVLVGALIASKTLFPGEILLAVVAASLICGAGNVINDYFDVGIDRINNPQRAIPSGRISPKAAYFHALMLFLFGNVFAAFINLYAILLALFNSVLLYLYAWKIKRRGGIGKNITISYLVASLVIFGGIAAGNPGITILLAVLAGLVNTGREVVKDIEDLKGDRKLAETLPKHIGPRKASLVAALFIMSAVVVSPLPYTMDILGIRYLAALVLADLVFVYSAAVLIRDSSHSSAKKTQRLIKSGMLLGLIAFLVGSL